MKTLKTIVVIAALILSAGAGFFVNYYLMNKNEDLNLKTEEEVKKELPYFDLDGVYLDKKNSNNEVVSFIVNQQQYASKKEELKPSLHQEVELKAFMGILRNLALFLDGPSNQERTKVHLKIGNFSFSSNEETSEETKGSTETISVKTEYTLIHKSKQILEYTTSIFAQTSAKGKESAWGNEKLTMSEELKRTDYAFYQLLQQIQSKSGIKITVKTCRVKDEYGSYSLYMRAFFKLPVKNDAGNNPSK